MRTILAQGLDVGYAQLLSRDTQVTQAEVFGDGIVFTVTGAFPQGLNGRRPIINLVPQVDIFLVVQLAVKEQVDHGELFSLADLLLRRQQLLPGIDTLAPRAQGPVKRLGAAADLAEIPIGEQIAQQAATQQQRDGQTVQEPREVKAYRHCDYPSLQH